MKTKRAAPLTVSYEKTREGWYVRIWQSKSQRKPAELGPFTDYQDAQGAYADYKALADHGR